MHKQATGAITGFVAKRRYMSRKCDPAERSAEFLFAEFLPEKCKRGEKSFEDATAKLEKLLADARNDLKKWKEEAKTVKSGIIFVVR